MKCANCGGDYRVELRTPDMDIQPVALCAICAVMGFDWRERLGVAAAFTPRRHQMNEGDTEWAPTNRVYYCEVHDSLVRKADVEGMFDVPEKPRDVQCDWAVASHIPFVVEACTVEVFNLTRQSAAALTPGDTDAS